MTTDHPILEILSFTVSYADGLSFKVPVKDAKSIDIIIAEGTVYQLTIHFRVREVTLLDLQYLQEYKLFGITMKKRHVDVGGEFKPRDTPYAVTLNKYITPEGLFYRRKFNCVSTYFANNQVLLKTPWTLTMTKK